MIGSPGSGTVIGVLVLVKINFEASRDCRVEVTFTAEAVWASFFSTAAAVSSEASWTTCGGVTADGAMLEGELVVLIEKCSDGVGDNKETGQSIGSMDKRPNGECDCELQKRKKGNSGGVQESL